jgi:hypothetical protein
MTTTRKHLIIDQYTKLINELEKYTDKSILPVLGDDFDVVELIVYFNYFFTSCNLEQEYKLVILDIIDANNIIIEPTSFDIVFPLIHEFLIWFKNLL